MRKSGIVCILLLLTSWLSADPPGTPSSPFNDQIVEHDYYSLAYSEEHEQARWVYYELTKSETRKVGERIDNFREDPEVHTGSADLDDYVGTDYHRGHLAPAADMLFCQEAMEQSFLMSNMSPQNGSLNSGKWKILEGYVRRWAFDNEAVYVVAGPILTWEPIEIIGDNEVTVPSGYYKVILDYTGDERKGIGFIFGNHADNERPEHDSVVRTIDQVEEVTGLDFFTELSPEEEALLEGTFDMSLWVFKQFDPDIWEEVVESDSPEPASVDSGTYWINSNNGTRHNSGCRYYDNTASGYFTDEVVGEACGICGG